MKLGMQPTLGVGFAAAVLAVGFVAYNTYRHYRDERADIAWARHADVVLEEIDATLLLLTGSQSAVRGFAISGKESFLAAHVDATARLSRQLDLIQSLMAGHPAQQQRAAELKARALRLLERQQRSVDIARQEGLGAAQKRINDGAGLVALAEIRELIDAMKRDERQERPSRWQAAELRATQAYVTNTVLTSALLLLLALCYFLVRHLFAIRAEREAMLQRLAATLDQRVRERTAQLEIAQRHQAQLASIVETSNDAIISVDANLNFATWNPGAERLLGYAATEIIGQPLWTVIPPDRHGETQKLFERLKRGESVAPFETVRRHKDGHAIPVAASASPIRAGGGGIVGVSGVFHDISERKRLEAEVSQISDHEQQRLGHDLHDGIGQKLTAIELMLYQLGEEPDTSRRREMIEQLGDNLRDSIREVRTLARGLAPFIVDEGGLHTALTTLVTGSAPATPRCRLRCPETLPRIEPQAALQLYRIAQEAFNNAVKHSSATEVEICLHVQDHTLQLQVVDDGRGCPPEQDGTTGLGRQIMRYRAELIGADYEFRSVPGEGVTVSCTLAVPT